MSYYCIKSKLSGFYLDVEGNGGSGSKIITWDFNGHDNQLFYDDNSTGTIRVKSNNCALTVENDQLIIKEVQPGNVNQQWYRQGDIIKNRSTGKVLDIYGENKEKLAKIGPFDERGGANQKWDFEMKGGAAPQVAASAPSPYFQGRKSEFQIESELNGKVLDIDGGKKEPGAKVLMWDKHNPPSANQLWYLDAQGNIRSSLNDCALSNGGKGQAVVTAVASGDPRSQFQFQGNKIASRAGEFLDISRANKSNGAEVCTWEANEGANQKWRKAQIN